VNSLALIHPRSGALEIPHHLGKTEKTII